MNTGEEKERRTRTEELRLKRVLLKKYYIIMNFTHLRPDFRIDQYRENLIGKDKIKMKTGLTTDVMGAYIRSDQDFIQ